MIVSEWAVQPPCSKLSWTAAAAAAVGDGLCYSAAAVAFVRLIVD